MSYEEEKACGCGTDCEDIKEENCGCDCDCKDTKDKNCGGGCDCEDTKEESCSCCGGGDGEDDENSGEGVITMTDTETGEEYTFIIADDFSIEDEHYCVLVTTDEKDPELVITKVVTLEDDSEGLMSLDDEEYDRVYAEYERLCEEDDDEDTDEDEQGEE